MLLPISWVLQNPGSFAKGSDVVVNLSGRGDKDMDIINNALEEN